MLASPMLGYMTKRNRQLSMLLGMVLGFVLLVGVALIASELTR